MDPLTRSIIGAAGAGPTGYPPEINSFYNSHTPVMVTDSYTLNWTTSNADYVTITGASNLGTLAANGTITVSTVGGWILTAYGSGQSVSQTLNVASSCRWPQFGIC